MYILFTYFLHDVLSSRLQLQLQRCRELKPGLSLHLKRIFRSKNCIWFSRGCEVALDRTLRAKGSGPPINILPYHSPSLTIHFTKTAVAFEMNDEFSRVLHQKMDFYSNDSSSDKIRAINNQIELVKTNMLENMGASLLASHFSRLPLRESY